MDFPANTVIQRKWFSELVTDIPGKHQLVYLKVTDKLCLEQIQQRRISTPERLAFDTEQMFYHISAYFEEPNEVCGFSVQVIERS